MVDGLFAVFAVVFGISRLYLYPFYAIWSVVDIWLYIGWAVTPMIGTFLALLLTLQALHIFWFSTIVQMVGRLLVPRLTCSCVKYLPHVPFS